MTETVGPLRARIRLERPTRVEDDLGGASIAWSDEGEVWAQIDAGGASQEAAYDAASSVTGYRVTLRARADVRAGWRVAWGARRLSVLAVEDEGAARITLVCEEEKL